MQRGQSRSFDIGVGFGASGVVADCVMQRQGLSGAQSAAACEQGVDGGGDDLSGDLVIPVAECEGDCGGGERLSVSGRTGGGVGCGPVVGFVRV